jgi:hypothetical protein
MEPLGIFRAQVRGGIINTWKVSPGLESGLLMMMMMMRGNNDEA